MKRSCKTPAETLAGMIKSFLACVPQLILPLNQRAGIPTTPIKQPTVPTTLHLNSCPFFLQLNVRHCQHLIPFHYANQQIYQLNGMASCHSRQISYSSGANRAELLCSGHFKNFLKLPEPLVNGFR